MISMKIVFTPVFHGIIFPQKLCLFYRQDAPCYPAFTFIQHPVESSTSLLLRGDAHGRIVIWLLPSVSEKQITLVRQESFDRLPSLPPKVVSSLSGLWTGQRSLCPGILDGLVSSNVDSYDNCLV